MNADLGEHLCAVARASVVHAARHGEPAPPPPAHRPELAEHRATFVTLTLRGALRGCIGSLHASRPLVEDVHANAWAAACRDPRFPPLAAVDATGLDVHVSVLSPLQPLPFDSRADLLQALRPGHDGLLIRSGSRQATFLPSVWEQLPEPARFLAALERKAGLPTGGEDFEALRYHCEGWHSAAPAGDALAPAHPPG